MPFILDQPDNAQSLINLKCALSIVPYDNQLTSVKLIDALKKVLNDDGKLLENCRHIGQIIENENITTLESYVENISLLLKK
jgi:UDP:flavonoid glycosyltransferase YjiC (YdhE family)